MTQLPETNRVQTVTERTYTWYWLTVSQSALRRITDLIQLAFVILNGLIGIRFLLKLMAANRRIHLPHFITAPFLWLFQGITYTPSFQGIQIEFFSLIAIVVYSLVCWIIVQLIWLLFSRLG